MKFLLFVFLFAFSEASPGYSGSTYSGNDIGQGSNGGNAYDYGYSGSTSGAGAGGFPSGNFPSGNFPSFVPFFPSFDFSSFFEQLNNQHQQFIKQLQSLAQGQTQTGYGTGSYAPGYQGTYQGGAQGASGGAGAGSYSGGGGYGSGFGLDSRGSFSGGYGGGYSGPDGSGYSFSGPIGSNAAFASGSIGPGGGHQTAAVYPENPSAPNINTRFGGGSSGDGGGFKSVFTSSKSVSSNVNGKPQTFREASTTINDNGKVTTYTARNP